MKTFNLDLRIFMFSVCLALGTLACADSDETAPPGTTDSNASSTASTTTDSLTTSVSDTTSTGTNSTVTTSDDSSQETTSTLPECIGPDGCFSCVPSTSVQLINACTTAQCQPFANTKERLPLLNDDGSLPPLP